MDAAQPPTHVGSAVGIATEYPGRGMNMTTKDPSGPRSFALIGPFSSGKTTLLENMLFAAGAVSRKGTVKEGNTVADGSPEARARQMSVEGQCGPIRLHG